MPEFRAMVSQEYLDGLGPYKFLANKYQIGIKTLKECIDNGPTEGFWGIIKSEMYQMYDITDESSLRFAIMDYLRFYSEERPQDRYPCKSPLEVRTEALTCDHSIKYPIPENKRIKKYKEKWCA